MKAQSIEVAWKGPEQCRECGIRHLVLFADLEHEDFALIHKPIDELIYKPGQVLYAAGDPPNHIFTVREGLVKLVQYLPDGGQRIVRLLRQGDVAGMEVLLNQPFQHHAIALEPVLVCRIPVAVVEKLSKQTPRLHRQMLTRWQQAVSKADIWLTELSTGPAQVRVARLLVCLARSHPDGVCYLPSREDIGAMLGITTETASRVTAEFRRKQYYKELGAKRAQVNVQALQELATAN
jgi:CRP-like cAMP-binding protein